MICQKSKVARRTDISARDIISRRPHTDAELAEIRRQREIIPLPRGIREDPAFRERETQHDAHGVIVAFECGGRLIGSIRAVAMLSQPTTSSENILKKHDATLLEVTEAAWEIGRLVISPEFRYGPDVLKRCLALAFDHFINHQKALHFFAPCMPALARLYRRFGFAVLLEHELPDGEGVFVLTHARVQDVAGALA